MKKARTMAVLFLTAAIWGFAFVAQVKGAESIGAFTYNGIRFALGSVSLIPVIYIFERDSFFDRKKIKRAFLAALPVGAFLFTASWLQQLGIEITGTAGKAGFITGLYTVLVPIFGIFLGRRPSVQMMSGAIIAVIGLFLISVNGDFSVGWGDLVLLIGAFFWAGHVLSVDRFVHGVSVLQFSMFQCGVAAVLSLICAVLFDSITLSGILDAKWALMYGGFLSVGVAYTLQVVGQRMAEANLAAIIFSTESIFSAIGGALILHERMSLRAYIGCALIFAGVVLSQLTFKKKKRHENEND